MRYLPVIMLLLFMSTAGFAQRSTVSDSVRAARIEQARQRIEQLRQSSGTPSPSVVSDDVTTAPPVAVPSAEKVVSRPNNVHLDAVHAKLDTLAIVDENYAQEIEGLSVSRLSLGELLRNTARVYGVNINAKGVENIAVTCNFARVRITDLLYFLCKEYGLDIDVTGNIVSMFPTVQPPPPPKVIKVSQGEVSGTMSYDLENDRLADVMRMVTSVGRVNFIIPATLNDRPLSGHGRDMLVDEAVVAITSANDLSARRNEYGIWELAANDEAGTYSRRSAFNEDQLFVDSLGLITARIAGGNAQEIITDLCETQGLNYFFVNQLSLNIPLDVHEVTFETLLGVMFTGSEYGYKHENGVYLFGTFNPETLGSVRVIPLSYRSVAHIDEIIPQQLKGGLELKTFPDLNSVIVSGDQRSAHRVESFMRSIDKRVPLVTIEVMIMDVTKSVTMEAGLGLGVGEAPSRTSGTLSPGIDMNLSPSAINDVIDRFGGFGSLNLGKVTPQFYMNLKMLEDNGTIEMHSTPKLSTLNGNPATLKSGEKSYYREVQTNFWGSMDPTPSESFTWKEINADLTIDITPFVSADSLITLEIDIKQDEFTDRVDDQDGPMGMVTRSFKSTIRVQDGEMVLLGGIDRNNKTISSSGLPFISRVPVLKWIFGNSKREKREHRLNVFIKPTLVE